MFLKEIHLPYYLSSVPVFYAKTVRLSGLYLSINRKLTFMHSALGNAFLECAPFSQITKDTFPIGTD